MCFFFLESKLYSLNDFSFPSRFINKSKNEVNLKFSRRIRILFLGPFIERAARHHQVRRGVFARVHQMWVDSFGVAVAAQALHETDLEICNFCAKIDDFSNFFSINIASRISVILKNIKLSQKSIKTTVTSKNQ